MKMSTFKQEICSELQRFRFRSRDLWVFQHYNPFRNKMKVPLTLSEFHEHMDHLVEEGLFTVEGNDIATRTYRLTEKGDNWLWGNS